MADTAVMLEVTVARWEHGPLLLLHHLANSMMGGTVVRFDVDADGRAWLVQGMDAVPLGPGHYRITTTVR